MQWPFRLRRHYCVLKLEARIYYEQLLETRRHRLRRAVGAVSHLRSARSLRMARPLLGRQSRRNARRQSLHSLQIQQKMRQRRSTIASERLKLGMEQLPLSQSIDRCRGLRLLPPRRHARLHRVDLYRGLSPMRVSQWPHCRCRPIHAVNRGR